MFSLFKKIFQERKYNINTQFRDSLGDNLYSLIQYGSSVKADAPNPSGINLLIVLNRSTPEAHAAIRLILLNNPEIEPFVMGKRGLDRTIQSFAVKFLSISRHYKLLEGQDILENLNISLAHERFLAEQALRNLRLKIIHCFVTRGPTTNYVRFIRSLTTSIIIDISEVLRCEQLMVPDKYFDRVAALSQHFDYDVDILRRIIDLKNSPRSLSKSEVENLHRNLFILLDNTLLYIENHWVEEH